VSADALRLRAVKSAREVFESSTGVSSAFTALADALERAYRAEEAKDGAYNERDRCVALIARMARQLGYTAGLGAHDPNDEAWDPAWRTIVFVDLPAGQVSWHIADHERPLFSFLPPYVGAWDGHTTPQKYERVASPLCLGVGGPFCSCPPCWSRRAMGIRP
jgi:hypothetical protein